MYCSVVGFRDFGVLFLVFLVDLIFVCYCLFFVFVWLSLDWEGFLGGDYVGVEVF